MYTFASWVSDQCLDYFIGYNYFRTVDISQKHAHYSCIDKLSASPKSAWRWRRWWWWRWWRGLQSSQWRKKEWESERKGKGVVKRWFALTYCNILYNYQRKNRTAQQCSPVCPSLNVYVHVCVHTAPMLLGNHIILCHFWEQFKRLPD